MVYIDHCQISWKNRIHNWKNGLTWESSSMSTIISKYLTLLVIVLSLVLGFVLPQVGLLWKPYLTVLLMIFMFSLTLSIEPSQIVRSISDYRIVGIGLFTVFVLMPSLSLVSRIFFSPIVYAGSVLAFCCPSAIATTFWAKVFKGDVATAMVISVFTNLISIVTIPVTMLIAVGTTVNVDLAGMMLNLAEIVLIPMAASLLLRKVIHADWTRLNKYSSKLELGILALLVWGSTAPGAAYASNTLPDLAVLNVFIFSLLASAFVLTHFLMRRFGRQKTISIEIATIVKNAALSLVLGLTAFGPDVLPPLIANLVAQNLLLVLVKALNKE
jgi:BASS family bile acid:Na+ symporter